jgi:hypothetical protein
MLLGVPVSDPPANLVQKIEALLFGQMSEIADEIGNGLLIACSTITLKYCYCSGSPSSMVSPIEHAFSPTYRSPQPTSAATAAAPSSKFIIKILFVSNVHMGCH